MTTREAQKLLNTKRKDSSILFNEEYKSDKDRHSFKCKKCSYIWENTPNVLKRKDNIGCPNCHEISLQIKSEKKAFSQVRGATKLLNSITLDAFEVTLPNDEINEMKKQIDRNKNLKEIQHQKVLGLQKDYDTKLVELESQLAMKTQFGFIFGLLLFPIWLLYQFEFDKKIEPYKKLVQTAKAILDEVLSEIQRLKRDIEYAEFRFKDAIKKLEYEKNLLRLQNRITIHQGGKTKLYYFRFHNNGKKYYKIGISMNGIDGRYKNKDGTQYGRIEKIFFDTYVREAERIEQLILHVFKDKLANDKSLLVTKGGYSEVFISDILGLDS